LHVRPDHSDAAIRQKAIAAFRQLVQRCVDAGKDGAIEICDSAEAQRPSQFCLIKLARDSDKIVGAAAFITRCRDTDAARKLLDELRC
jgi:hypothetical protein